jgi:hypothetical protein
MPRTRSRIIRFTLGLASAGMLFSTSCSSIASYFKNFNYGGTVLNMTPIAYRFLTSGYEGPGVDPDIDPACTYPPFCASDPFVP